MSGKRKRIDIIVNPTAGGRRSGLFDAVLRHLHDDGAFVRCFDTECAGHATQLAATCVADGRADVIVAAGGDGTINEVARGLLGTGVPLGLIPLGTANVLAIEIGLKLRATSVADTLLSGEAKLIGTGLFNDEIFLLMAGMGFDGTLIANIDPLKKKRFGKLAFVWEGLKLWIKGPGAELSLSVDGVTEKAAWVVVTNARHYAGPFVLSTTTDVMETGLDVFLFRWGNRLAFAGYFLGLALGRVSAMPGVDLVRAQSVETMAGKDTAVEVDGDARGIMSVRISQGGQILRLVVPQT